MNFCGFLFTPAVKVIHLDLLTGTTTLPPWKVAPQSSDHLIQNPSSSCMSVLSKTLSIVDNIQQTWTVVRCLAGDSLCSSHRTRISCLPEEAGNRRGSDELQVHFCSSNLTSAQCYLAGLCGWPFDIVEIAISFCLGFFDRLELRPSSASVQGARACKGQTYQEWKSFGFKICLEVPLWLPLSFYV